MRKILLIVFGGIFITVCFFTVVFHHISNRNGIAIKVNENDNHYRFYASYERYKAKKLQHFIDAKLHTNYFFNNTRMNGQVVLDDHTSFYLRTTPGKIYINLDKHQNDDISYTRIKQLGEEIKIKLTEN
ncbi:MAG: hypothetical protein RLZZ28_2226 [Bacteroidota bacterium]|jgi:hypothetical protein